MSSKAWGGRFGKTTDKVVEAFTESISFDYRLFEHDIRGSIAHARMLGRQGIISQPDSDLILQGLEEILASWQTGEIDLDPSAEDVHMNVERLLFDRIGEAAGRLHTARSRNDQVATDLRLFLKEEIGRTVELILNLQRVVVDQAEANLETVMPGYTHLQHAQPVLMGHHLMAWFWMLERDKGRLTDCSARFNELPLGSGALAGTTFPIDREFVAKELGFARVSENSMESVADRDFATEFVAAAAMLMVHLSRFSEEIVLWNTSEFGFVDLDDSVTTGSSIMPQKKNPDVAELVRGKSGRVFGDLVSLLTIQKGLPLAYNRDLQEDKEPIFDAVDTIQHCLAVFGLMLKTARFNAARLRTAAGEAFSTATDLADHLVRRGVPFRDAHAQVGALVAYCVRCGKEMEDLTYKEISNFAPLAAPEVTAELTVDSSVSARSAYGGTAHSEVERQIGKARNILG